MKPVSSKNPIKEKVVAAFKKKFGARKLTSVREDGEFYLAVCYGDFDAKERSFKLLGTQKILKSEVV